MYSDRKKKSSISSSHHLRPLSPSTLIISPSLNLAFLSIALNPTQSSLSRPTLSLSKSLNRPQLISLKLRHSFELKCSTKEISPLATTNQVSLNLPPPFQYCFFDLGFRVLIWDFFASKFFCLWSPPIFFSFLTDLFLYLCFTN